MTRNMEIANTIRNQIGPQAMMMLGAKDYLAIESGLAFRVRGSKTVSHIRITLNALDLYDMEFIKIRGTNMKTVATEEGIYNDMLRTMIEKHTGLYTRL